MITAHERGRRRISLNREECIMYIEDTFAAHAEFPWKKYPNYIVFRHSNNRKWFAAILDIPKTKLGFSEETKVDILNLKCDPILADTLKTEAGIFPGYHMNKANWISVALDGSVPDSKIKLLLDISFDLTATKSKPQKTYSQD